MRCDEFTQEQYYRVQRARRNVVLVAECCVSAGQISDELRNALRIHSEELRTFESMVSE